MMNLRKCIVGLILLLGIGILTGRPAQAATYETIGSFVEKLAEEIGIAPTKEAAVSAGLIRETELKNWNKTLTRTDAAVYLDRADAILYDNDVDADLVAEIIEKRISDIKTIVKSKRESVAKAYARGIIKGYKNGNYSTNREFRGKKKVTTSVADGWIKLLKDMESRHQISPDGQVIRTKNLPSNADLFPYILDSYPNEYYDWELRYMKGVSYYEDPEEPTHMIGIPWMYHPNRVYLKDYAAPVDVQNLICSYGWYDDYAPSLSGRYKNPKNEISTEELIERGLDQWVETTKLYFQTAFSFDYMTVEVGDEWYQTMLSTLGGYGNYTGEYDERDLNYYVNAAIDNKVTIEVDTVAVDGSTLYWYDGDLLLRVYVRFRFTSVSDSSNREALVFTQRAFGPSLSTIEIGAWKDGYYDVELSGARTSDASDRGVECAELVDSWWMYNALDKWDGED